MEELDERKLLLIPAMPSSGTSALAGVLHYLGVNMGNCNEEDQTEKRGYEMFEDDDTWRYASRPNRDADRWEGKLTGTILRIRGYVNYRLWKDEGPVGAKIPAVLCMYDREIETLPILTLNVHRPFEQSVMSDRRTMVKQGKYKPIQGDIDKILAANRMRASDMGTCYVAKMDLFSHHEPIVNVTFDELISQREEMVHGIADTIDIGSTEEQIQSAIDFLDKDKKHS